jgi:hypothetical protein
MKKLLALLLLFAATTAFAENYFPGLKVVLTPQEFVRAGLDKLTPDQLGVIDAAIIRHYVRTIENVAAQANIEAGNENERGWLSKFGLPDVGDDYRDKSGIKGRCTAWVGGNSFRLDNAQIWEGIEPINFELVGKEIEIQPRPGGMYSLVVGGKNTTVRVRRIK